MTVSHGVEGQLISEARICIYSDIKALRQCDLTAPRKGFTSSTHPIIMFSYFVYFHLTECTQSCEIYS